MPFVALITIPRQESVFLETIKMLARLVIQESGLAQEESQITTSHAETKLQALQITATN